MNKIIFVLLMAAVLLLGCTTGEVVPDLDDGAPDNTGGAVTGTVSTTTTNVNGGGTEASAIAADPGTDANKSKFYGEGVEDAGVYYNVGMGDDDKVYTVEECEASEGSFTETVFYVNYQKPDPFIEGVYLRVYIDGRYRAKAIPAYAPTTETIEVNLEINDECYEGGWIEMYNDGNGEILWDGPVFYAG